MLCFSLALFCANKVEGWLVLGGFLLVAHFTDQSLENLRANCNRAVVHNDTEES